MARMIRSLLFALLAAKARAASHSTSGSCRAKNSAEKGFLEEAGCPDAKPTDCPCATNQAPVSDCSGPEVTLWASTGKKCVTATPDKNSDWEKHNWEYPADYWNYCPPPKGDEKSNEATWKYWIEPGSYHCTMVEGQTHEWKNPSPGYNSHYNSTGWCTSAGCYVDPCTCNKNDIAASSWFQRTDGGKIYYSYEACGGTNTFTDEICQGLSADKAGCEAEDACIWDTSDDSASSTSADSSGADRFARPILGSLMAALVYFWA